MAENKKDKRVKPQVLKGFRDYSPGEELARRTLIAKAVEVVERYGFLPIQTPSLEAAEILLGADYTDDNLKELFGFVGPEKTDMALRYEFTLSLARYVAGNPLLPLPFRRYQYGNVWRVDKPGPGRFREFTQFDLDIVGSSSTLADAEVMATMITILDTLGIKNFTVHYSNRKLINGLTSYADIPADKATDVFRVIDKLPKQGKEAVLLELGPGRTDVSGDKIPGLYLSDKQIKTLEDFLNIAEQTDRDQLDSAEELLGDIAISKEGIDELRQIKSYLNRLGIAEGKSRIDITIVRGLGYYTGPVFETILNDLPEFGSVFSGGRYDNMVGRFSGKNIPATGTSFGVDRMLSALIELKAIKMTTATSKVLVTTMDKNRLDEYIIMLREIRDAGINAELFLGETKNINKQLKYADRVGIPIAVIAGSDEFENGTVTVKDLRAGQEKSKDIEDREEWLAAEDIQVTIERGRMIAHIKKLLDKK